MRLLQLQFGGVLAGDDAFGIVDVAREAVQECRLARAGAAGNQHVYPAAADHLQEVGAMFRDGAERLQLLQRELVAAEFSDRQCRPVDRQRRHDHVDARAVRQARVADRARFIDAPADLADDALTDVQDLRVVAKANVGALNFAFDFDIDRVRAVHHDVGDVVAREQRLERPVTQHVVADVLEQLFLLGDRHHDVLDRDDLADDVADFLARRHRIELGELREVDRLDQRAEDLAFDLVEGVRTPRFGKGRRRRCDRRRGHRRGRCGHFDAGGAAAVGGLIRARSRSGLGRRRLARRRLGPLLNPACGTPLAEHRRYSRRL